VIRTLIESGTEPDTINQSAETPLHWAAQVTLDSL